MRTLKSYVRNKCHPEGSIAEGYLAEECLTFCSRYLFGIETKFNRPSRNVDDHDSNGERLSIFTRIGCGNEKEELFCLDNQVLSQAHRYVLLNCNEVDYFIRYVK